MNPVLICQSVQGSRVKSIDKELVIYMYIYIESLGKYNTSQALLYHVIDQFACQRHVTKSLCLTYCL